MNKKQPEEQTKENTNPEKTTEQPAKETPPNNPTDDELRKMMTEAKPNVLEKPQASLWLDDKGTEIPITIYSYSLSTSPDKISTFSRTTIPGLDALGGFQYPINAKFTIPTRQQLKRYRESATRWSNLSETMVYIRPLVCEQILKHHLKELKIIGAEGENIVLEHDKRGVLTDETMELLDKLHPSILDMLVEEFIKESVLMI